MGNCLPCLVHEHKISKTLVVSVNYGPDERAAGGATAEAANETATSSKSSVNVVEDGSKEDDAVRIRIVMTKKEAAQMLSLLAGGCQKLATEKKAADVPRGAKGRRRPQYRGRGCCWRPVLASIPEE